MNMNTRTTNGHTTITFTTRHGQQIPSISDEVCVRAHILIPCVTGASGASFLSLEINFCARCIVANEGLSTQWGHNVAAEDGRPQGRERVSSFAAATWATAEAEADAWATAETDKLHSAITARARALADA
jgi:hypothetical protein